MKEMILKKIKEILNNQDLIDNFKNTAKSISTALFIIFIVVMITNLLYQEKRLVKRGYKAEIVENKPVANKIKDIDGISVGSLPKIKKEELNISDFMELADIKKGKKTFKKCAACHNAEKNAPNKIGPNLYGVVNRKIASTDFKYSDALASKSGEWNYDELSKFLKKPRDYAPGTKMAFAGLKKDKDRANIIAYLESIN